MLKRWKIYIRVPPVLLTEHNSKETSCISLAINSFNITCLGWLWSFASFFHESSVKSNLTTKIMLIKIAWIPQAHCSRSLETCTEIQFHLPTGLLMRKTDISTKKYCWLGKDNRVTFGRIPEKTDWWTTVKCQWYFYLNDQEGSFRKIIVPNPHHISM